MPESVTDRPTSATEMIFLLSKQARYFYDADAVREPAQSNSEDGRRGDGANYAFKPTAQVTHMGVPSAGANQRNYWLLSPEPYPDAHFATFPTEIPRRAILAGTSERGACPACGAPWRRVVERAERGAPHGKGVRSVGTIPPGHPTERFPEQHHNGLDRWNGAATTTDWQPSCRCEPVGKPVPQIVLDPFAGAGTTLLVADRLGRDAIGVELNPEYARMAEDRVRGDAPLFAEITA